MGTCLECEENIEIDEGVDVGDIIECPECKTRLEVLDHAWRHERRPAARELGVVDTPSREEFVLQRPGV